MPMFHLTEEQMHAVMAVVQHHAEHWDRNDEGAPAMIRDEMAAAKEVLEVYAATCKTCGGDAGEAHACGPVHYQDQFGPVLVKKEDMKRLVHAMAEKGVTFSTQITGVPGTWVPRTVAATLVIDEEGRFSLEGGLGFLSHSMFDWLKKNAGKVPGETVGGG